MLCNYITMYGAKKNFSFVCLNQTKAYIFGQSNVEEWTERQTGRFYVSIMPPFCELITHVKVKFY
jgi:hypothetical protein